MVSKQKRKTERSALLPSNTNSKQQQQESDANRPSTLSQLATHSLGSLAWLVRTQDIHKDELMVLPSPRNQALPLYTTGMQQQQQQHQQQQQSSSKPAVKDRSNRSLRKASIPARVRLLLPNLVLRRIAGLSSARDAAAFAQTSASMKRALLQTRADVLSNSTSTRRKSRVPLSKTFWLSTHVSMTQALNLCLAAHPSSFSASNTAQRSHCQCKGD